MIERIASILMEILLNIKIGIPYEKLLKIILHNSDLSVMLFTILLLKNIIKLHEKNL